VHREEALSSFRGRLRAGDQARRRFGLPLPVEVSYDDFTVDVEENRLLKAALLRLSRFRFEDPSLRRQISEALSPLAEVTAMRYPKRAIPRVSYTRLNLHYRGAVELARLLLQNTSVELRAGDVLVGQFLVDMNDLFEDFIFEAIRRRLPAGPVWRHGKWIYLDEEERVLMKPDLSWWRGRECLFVGDAKYKRTGEGKGEDLYQLLAYCQATGRRSGMLIYAEGEETTHVVRRSGVRREVVGVDLGAPWEKLEARIDEIAAAIAADAGVLPALAAA
jgi:5-methylcytosine-specific restriction enzyme subunit McrC